MSDAGTPGRPCRTSCAAIKPGLRVVAIGGGTGLSTLLKGLKRYVSPSVTRFPAEPGEPVICELCAVVTVSDDGGSSGRLRKEFNMLPPGDIRNCIVALSEDEALLSRLFQHRFRKGLRTRGPQLRQSFSGCADFHHQRFQRSGTPVFRDSAHARAHLSRPPPPTSNSKL